MITSTERVRAWRKANPAKALAILRGQQEREGGTILARSAAWAKANPERRQQIKSSYDDRRRSDRQTWARHIVSSIKSRCKKRGLPFSITIDDILSAMPADGNCPALGIALTFGKKLSRSSPSIDRRIPALGYVAGNISVISHKANSMKQDCVNSNELRMLADFMDRGVALSAQRRVDESRRDAA